MRDSRTRNANVVTSPVDPTRDNGWTQTVELVCEGCYGPMHVIKWGHGPRPKYHGAACRQRAYRTRKMAGK